MIIVVKCCTCNKVLANKWEAYRKACEDLEQKGKDSEYFDERGESLAYNFMSQSKGKILDTLGLDRICCRRHMLGHVELIDVI